MGIKILIFVIGIALILWGGRNQLKTSKKMKSGEYEEIEGTVVDFKREESYDSENGYSTYYYPIYEYEVNGQKYTYTSKLGRGTKMGLGKQGKLLYNKNNPQDVFSPRDKTGLVLTVCGVLMIVEGIISIVNG